MADVEPDAPIDLHRRNIDHSSRAAELNAAKRSELWHIQEQIHAYRNLPTIPTCEMMRNCRI